MKEVVPFWIMAAIGIAFSIVGAALARHIAIKHSLDHFETTLLVLFAPTSCPSPSSGSLKLLIFNRLFRTELEEFDEHLTHERGRGGERPQAALSPAQRRPGPLRRAGPDQSRKFSNCSGMPKSSALHLAITSWRSSRFLPVTRS